MIRDSNPVKVLFTLTDKQMANSPTDKSKDFIKSGMTLITQRDSDKYLKQHKQKDDASEQGQFPAWTLNNPWTLGILSWCLASVFVPILECGQSISTDGNTGNHLTKYSRSSILNLLRDVGQFGRALALGASGVGSNPIIPIMKIQFYTHEIHRETIPEPVPASKVFPEWYSSIELESRPLFEIDGDEITRPGGGSIKRCPGVQDIMKTGYILRSWEDFVFRESDSGELFINWLNDVVVLKLIVGFMIRIRHQTYPTNHCTMVIIKLFHLGW